MNWTALQGALVTWVSGQTGLTTVWAGQSAARPAYPFAVLNIIAESQLGVDETRYTLNGTTGLLDPSIVGNRLFTLSIHVHTLAQTPAASARAYLSTLRASLQKASVLAAFRTVELAVVRALGSQTLDQQVDGHWTSVGLMDVQFAAVETVADAGEDYIEHVDATGTFPPSDLEITGPFEV